jgi:hypothetical protein
VVLVTTLSPTFSRGVREMQDGKILAPILRGEVKKPNFRPFNIKVEPPKERPWDGYWHPSTHGLMPARQLALSLKHPMEFEAEETTLEKVFAVTQGHLFHTFCFKVLRRNGILLSEELPVLDEEHNRRGHMDGFLANYEGLEFKTVNNDFLLKKIEDVESLRKYKPGYYAQIQEYLDILQLSAMRFFMMGMFYPYPMIEFPIFYDEPFQLARRAEYRAALAYAREDGALPDPCCEPRSKEAKNCPLRTACPIGRVALGMPAKVRS